MKKRLIISVAFLFVIEYGLCQDNYLVDHYDSNSGLASEWAWSITQDSLGFIWIAYPDGLSRFDGYNFKVFRHDPDDSTRSGLNFTLGRFLENPSKAIWLAEHHQPIAKPFVMVQYDHRNDSFHKLSIDVDSAFVTRVWFDKDGKTIWLGTHGSGIYSYDKPTGKVSHYVNYHEDSEIRRRRNSIRGFAEGDSILIISSLEGFWMFDKQGNNFRRPLCKAVDSSLVYHSDSFMKQEQQSIGEEPLLLLSMENKIIKLNSRFDILELIEFPPGLMGNGYAIDDDGLFWFPDRQGVTRYDSKERVSTRVPFSITSYHQIMKDRDGNIWVASGNGIHKIRKSPLSSLNIDLSNYRSSIFRAPEDDYLLVARKATGSSMEMDNRRNEVIMAKLPSDSPGMLKFKTLIQEIKGDAIEGFYQGKSMLWMGNIANGTEGEPAVVALPIDPETGFLKIESRIDFYHDSKDLNKISLNSIVNIWEDVNENVWISLRGGGMEMINRKVTYGGEGAVLHYPSLSTTGYFSPQGNNSFWSFDYDRIDLLTLSNSHGAERSFSYNVPEMPDFIMNHDSTLFLATFKGLYLGRISQGGFVFDKEPIWEGGHVKGLQVDDTGRYWFLIENGLVCFDPVERISSVFRSADGVFRTGDQNPQRIHKTRSGLMLTGDHDGFSFFDPSSFRLNRSIVVPILTKLLVKNEERNVGNSDDDFFLPSDITTLDQLSLDYQHNNFSVEFSAMEMTMPEKNVYRHMLDGYDRNWIETDYKNRTATYTSLPVGTYTFRVQASNHYGVWSDKERTLKVIILPPPWRTWWAYTGYSLLAIGLLLLARRNIVQRERLKSNLALEKVEREKEHFELEKAKEVDRVKTSFFTNISHEFRTPLTLIKGPVDAMLDRFKDDPEVVQRLKLVQRNSELLLRLINQLLDLAKLESGSLKVEKSAGEVHGFIRAIASGFDSHARQKGVTLVVNVPDEAAQVMFDKDKVETILINLVNNAIKFTPQGGRVTLKAACVDFTAEAQRRRGELAIEVSDTGIGIPKDQQNKVFERFHQVSESHKEVGTGIGLALVKELVNLMGGTIKVDSELGKGSTFTVVLPVEEASSQIEQVDAEIRLGQVSEIPSTQRPAPSADTETIDPTKPQILVVEDNADVRGFIIDSLGEDYIYIEAVNGRQGLEKATSEVPDLIISDVMMPEMDGITMAGKIKEDRNTSHIPLILLTAKSTEESKLSGLSSGADDYLTKPFNKQELLLKVRNSINRQNKLKEMLRGQLLTEAPKEKVLSQDEQFLQKVKETIIQQMSDEQLSVESLADDMGMSRVQLYRKVSALTGMAVNELIRKLRLQRAAQLLGQNWGPVSQVAYEVGFSNLSYFSKVFKEEYGKLPSEYAERT